MSTSVRRFINLRRKFVLIFLAGAAIFSYFSSGAIAEPPVGSLVLSDLNEILLNQSAELRQEVRQALKEVGKDDVGCVAPIILRPSTDLHHSRVAPFSCFFADNKSLTIQAENLAILPDGEAIYLEQLLKRNNIPQRVSLQFSLTSWQWTDVNHQSAVNEVTMS